MTGLKRKLNLVLSVLALLLLTCTAALAAPIGNIRVVLKDVDEKPVPNINVELFQVAYDDGGTLRLNDDYADLGISADALAADPAGNAEKVYQYVQANELEDQLLHTSEEGIAAFYGLRDGVYLVMERGGQTVSFAPYLVVLPTELGGILHHQIRSEPKISFTDTRTVLVMKLWEDDLNAAGTRPAELPITLLRDGKPFRSVTLNEQNAWMHAFYQLPEDGVYSVKEPQIFGYKAEVISVAEGFLLVNEYVGGTGGGGGETPEPPAKGRLTVRKVWDDANDLEGKRPNSVTVQLIVGKTVLKTASLNAANHWTHTFTELDESASYTVREIPVENYTASYSGGAASGITVTNRYTPGTTDPGTTPDPIVPTPQKLDIPLTVRWVDESNAFGKRPERVTVHLIANGSVVSSLTLDKGSAEKPYDQNSLLVLSSGEAVKNEWYGVYRDVPADLAYSVWELAVPEYSTTYSGNAAEGFIVTNVYTEGTTDPGLPPEPTVPDPPTPPDTSPPPVKPSQPEIPQTGVNMLPIYAAIAVGALLVLAGLLRRKRLGAVLAAVGLCVTFFAVGAYAVYDRQAAAAGENAQILLRNLNAEMAVQKEKDIYDPAVKEEVQGQMPHLSVSGYSAVGIVSAPSIGLQLPVLEQWDYDRLDVAPCRYSGSAEGEDLIILGHNYKLHFDRLAELKEGDAVTFCDVRGTEYSYTVTATEILKKTELDRLTGSDAHLTLCTCTKGGYNRIVIRCDQNNVG